MTRLSPVLTTADLPLSELHAARLDGELFPLNACFCPIDEPEWAGLRAETISRQWPDRLIAEQRSAAWVLGVLPFAPERHELCADIAARARPASLHGVTVREVVIEPDEIVRIGRLDVTNPLRTLVDIARFSSTFSVAEYEICAALAELGGVTLEDCMTALDRRRNLPNKRVARKRLSRLSALAGTS
jgi:hypothetical protein